MVDHALNTHRFSYKLIAEDATARRGIIQTAHGEIDTPAFMTVGTAGTVKGLHSDALRKANCQCILSNTYHLLLRPGGARIEALGGLHRFMDWPNPILTDSGGFQVMSLSGLRTIDEEGVTFQSHIDGSRHRLTPETCMHLQFQFDSTITMVLDECTPFPATHEVAKTSMERSMRWAALCRSSFVHRQGYALFGIVQGGTYCDLRRQSAESLLSIGFDGYAIGGLAVGEGQPAMLRTLDYTVPALPRLAPRYLMGVGTPDDILAAVERGVDMFDCVIPTRAGRTARAYTPAGTYNMRNARFADDGAPLDLNCECPACQNHSRAYLHHLFRAGEMLGPILLTWHNVTYYQSLMRDIRRAIEHQRFAALASELRLGWTRGN
jgi:queuine tRNA-ribosyltransferase